VRVTEYEEGVYGAALLSALHLLGLGVALGSIFSRTRAFRRLTTDASALDAVFFADNFWGISALISMSTGLFRAFGSWEKGSGYYLHSGAFLLKMAIVGVVLVLELFPMITLIRWRVARGRGQAIDTARAGLFFRISAVQTALTIATPFVASLMARGLGFSWLST